MASISCTFRFHASSHRTPSSRSPKESLRSSFLSSTRRTGASSKLRAKVGGGSNGSRAISWFRFGSQDSEGAGIYGSQSREDFDRDDVEQYFNYMGMLAVEGTYDKMEALLNQNIHPVDILLLLAASEGDQPKIEELLRAGASYTIKDAEGRTALDRAASDEIKEFILGYSVQSV